MLTEPTLNDVYERLGERLGRLTAGVDGLRDDLSEAKADREKLAGKVDGIADRTARLEQIIDKIEPTVDGLATLRTRALGGLAVILFVGGVAGYVAGLWLTELKLWLVRVIAGH